MWRKHSFFLVTGFFFLSSLVGHWFFGWFAYIEMQVAHNQPVVSYAFMVETLRDTFENWQAAFLQVMWQVLGLTFVFYAVSPGSKENDDRKEEKLDAIIRTVHPSGEEVIRKIDKKHPRQ